jgi:hypothetical protein
MMSMNSRTARDILSKNIYIYVHMDLPLIYKKGEDVIIDWLTDYYIDFDWFID